MIINFELILESIPALLRGTQLTLIIACGGCIIGFLLGTVLGIIQARVKGIPGTLVQVFTNILRGTPMLMQIIFMYYLLPAIGSKMSAVAVAIVAIGINSAAYISQVIRSGIMSVGEGQIEAAKVLGLDRLQTLWYIILPQALRVVVPALGNELATLIKDSSLASTIGVMELFKEGRSITYETLDAISILFAVGVMYLLLTGTVSIIMHYVEQRMNRISDER